MDVFSGELLKFWKCLNEAGVRYIMVGGLATNLNGFQRTTGDVDIWIEDTIENRQGLRKAFLSCNMGDFQLLETIQFLPGGTDFSLNNGLRLDIITNMKGLEEIGFNECFNQCVFADIDTVQVPFLHINHLLQNKKAVNRPKDQLDVIYFEKIQKLREEEGL